MSMGNPGAGIMIMMMIIIIIIIIIITMIIITIMIRYFGVKCFHHHLFSTATSA